MGFIRQSCTFTLGGAAGSNCENSWVSQSSTVTVHEHKPAVLTAALMATIARTLGNAWGSYNDVNNQFMILNTLVGRTTAVVGIRLGTK